MAGRGRPRAFDRDAALHAAMKLFWRKGYTATSLAELCDAMGIGSPSLYAAFGSKEALYEAAIQHYSMIAAPRIFAALTEAATAREAVAGFLQASAAALPAADTPGGCMVMLSAVREEGCERLGRMVAAIRQASLDGLEARLAKGVAAGELSPAVDLRALARFYLSVQQGMSVQARDGATAADLQAVAVAAMAAWPAHAPAG